MSDEEPPLFHEVYGYNASVDVPQRWERPVRTKSGGEGETRVTSECPFTRYACWKHGQAQIGACSISDSKGNPVITCPKRFQTESLWQDFHDVLFIDEDGEYATDGVVEDLDEFVDSDTESVGDDRYFEVLEEVTYGEVGSIDLLPVVRNSDDEVVDFAPIELQSSYFSGDKIKPAFEDYVDSGMVDVPRGSRRIDYRSCIDKRLLPQMLVKAQAVQSSAGKVFGVVIQDFAFDESNILGHVEFEQSITDFSSTPALSEIEGDDAHIAIFVYAYEAGDPQYALSLDTVYLTTIGEMLDAAERMGEEIDKHLSEIAEEELDTHVSQKGLYIFLYNRAGDEADLGIEWYPEKIRVTDLPGVGKKTARKVGPSVTVIEDLLGDENEALAGWVKEAVASHRHDALEEYVLEKYEEAMGQREEGEAERARELDDWLDLF
jgi:hypothetical protein